jgi:hypothetical protein
MNKEKKQVFIIGLDAFNLAKLEKLPDAARCEFHSALDIGEMRNVDEFHVDELLKLCCDRIDAHGRIDAIASYFDFPGTLLVPIIAEKYGLPGPSVESMFKCEHKYWSRLEQSKVIDEHIPKFQAFDPFDEQAFEKLAMISPFWIKPIKSFRSYLAYRINGEAQFYEYMETVRRDVGFITTPFIELMKTFNMPEELASMPETCIAESPITGHQCTLEGYVYNGRVVTYGVVDSIREGDRSSFGRYEYPSNLPQEIQFRMADVTRRAITQLGLDNGPFNAEYFYDQTADEVYLLEINPRISQSHSDIFEKVHGISHHSVMLSLALGEKPRTLGMDGEFNKAANCMLRTFEPGKVTKVPTRQEINILKKFIPGLEVNVQVRENVHLSDLKGQDSYSFELANIFVGARDQRELVEKYHQVVDGLSFEIEYDEKTQLY